jgi:hypothetical protein
MAKGEGRGVKSYVPSVRGVVKILIVLVILKIVISYAGPQLPTAVQKFVPVF